MDQQQCVAHTDVSADGGDSVQESLDMHGQRHLCIDTMTIRGASVLTTNVNCVVRNVHIVQQRSCRSQGGSAESEEEGEFGEGEHCY